MNEIPQWARERWEKEGLVCDCCEHKIPIEIGSETKWWYDLELHRIVCQCLNCQREGRKPKGSGN